MSNKRNRKYKKSKRRKQYGGKYRKGGSKSRKKQKGGNLGQHYTLRPYNNLANGDIKNELKSTNGNNNVPIPYMKSGGGRGTFMQQFGVVGDLYNGALNIGNKVMDVGDVWNGKPTQSNTNSSHVTNQPINKSGGSMPEFDFDYHKTYTNNLTKSITSGGGKRRRKSRKSRHKKRKSRKSRRRKRRKSRNSRRGRRRR